MTIDKWFWPSYTKGIHKAFGYTCHVRLKKTNGSRQFAVTSRLNSRVELAHSQPPEWSSRGNLPETA